MQSEIIGYFRYAVINGELTRWKYCLNGERQTKEGEAYYARFERTKQALTADEFDLSLEELEAKYPPPPELATLSRVSKNVAIKWDGIRKGSLSKEAKIDQLREAKVDEGQISEIIDNLYPEEVTRG